MIEQLHMLELDIPGGCGRLEGRLYYGEDAAEGIGMILCSPHPLLAGNMDNNVIQAIAQAVAVHMPVLMFNYPAVGKSTSPQPGLPLFEVWNALDQEKTYHGIAQEVSRVIGWSKTYFPQYHLVGYSFGACMALAALTPEALSYTAIAPPLLEEDFSRLPTFSLPICLIAAERDNLVAEQVLHPHQSHIKQVTIQGADHFFRGSEQEVSRWIVDFVMV
ncbi:MAG: hypothetical protein PHI97_06255 [Desulfobulbus sp.]|nr:hypothetical protein [Desulfobulbus sp.]